MIASDDLLDRLRSDLEEHRTPTGPGPDVATISRRGAARRRRRRAAVVGATLVPLAAGLAVVPMLGPSPSAQAPASLTAATPGTSDHAEVQAIMESALDAAGIEHLDAQLQAMTSGEFGSLRGYHLSWTVPATDGGSAYLAEFSVFPGAASGGGDNAAWSPDCERPQWADEQRGCVVVRSGDAVVWSEHYEALEQGWWEDVLRTNEWAPRATAALADDTAVTLNVRRNYGPGPEVADSDITPYAAPIQASQLETAATSPQLARIELP